MTTIGLLVSIFLAHYAATAHAAVSLLGVLNAPNGPLGVCAGLVVGAAAYVAWGRSLRHPATLAFAASALISGITFLIQFGWIGGSY